MVESETTSATLGKAGVRKHNPMANLDFIVVPVGLYFKNHLAFGRALEKTPKIFHTNYFLKEDGKFLNSMLDKKVWIMWMEGRVHNDFSAVETPIGFIPQYEDLKKLFAEVLNKDYSKEDYEKQFQIKIDKFLEKVERVEKIFQQEEDIPGEFLDHLNQEKERLVTAKERFGKNIISPFDFA
jgi:phosphoenolpyruvate carboxykinase (GTP)